MADILLPVAGGAFKKLVDQGDGTHAEGVALVGLVGDVEITGDANVDTSALEALVGPLDDPRPIPKPPAPRCWRCCAAFSPRCRRKRRC